MHYILLIQTVIKKKQRSFFSGQTFNSLCFSSLFRPLSSNLLRIPYETKEFHFICRWDEFHPRTPVLYLHAYDCFGSITSQKGTFNLRESMFDSVFYTCQCWYLWPWWFQVIIQYKKTFMPSFYGWGSTASRLQSHYEVAVYFLY